MSKQPQLIIRALGMPENCRWLIIAHSHRKALSFSYEVVLESGEQTVCHSFAKKLEVRDGVLPRLDADTNGIFIKRQDIDCIREFIADTADYVNARSEGAA